MDFFYQYEVIITQYIRLVNQAIQSYVCKVEATKNGFPLVNNFGVNILLSSEHLLKQSSKWSIKFHKVLLVNWLLNLQ